MTDEELQTEAQAICEAVGLSYTQGSVGWTGDGWIVYIFANRKKPPLVKWKGLPVDYRIGCGMPVANAAT